MMFARALLPILLAIDTVAMTTRSKGTAQPGSDELASNKLGRASLLARRDNRPVDNQSVKDGDLA